MNVGLFDRVIRLRVIDQYDDDREGFSPEASLKVVINGREDMSAGSGDGPVNAMDNAIRSMLLNNGHKAVSNLTLQDYHVVKVSDEGSAASVRVTITMSNHDCRAEKSAESTNQNEAGFVALCECYKELLDIKEAKNG